MSTNKLNNGSPLSHLQRHGGIRQTFSHDPIRGFSIAVASEISGDRVGGRDGGRVNRFVDADGKTTAAYLSVITAAGNDAVCGYAQLVRIVR